MFGVTDYNTMMYVSNVMNTVDRAVALYNAENSIYAFMGKGGVGKSTLSVEFANMLHEYGIDVVVVGVDAQHNAGEIIMRKSYPIPYIGIHKYSETADKIRGIIADTMFSKYADYVEKISPDFISMIALCELITYHRDEYSVMVVDFPPNHAAINMLFIPNYINGIIMKVISIKDRIKALVGRGGVSVKERIDELKEVVLAFKNMLPSIRFIPIMDRSFDSVNEVFKLADVLYENGASVYNVIFNRKVADPSCPCERCRTHYDEERRAISYYLDECAEHNLKQKVPVFVRENRFSDLIDAV